MTSVAQALKPDDGVRTENEFVRGWKPLLAAAVSLGLGLSPVPTYTVGVFAIALQKDFHWSRASIMASSTLSIVVLIVLGPLFGRLADRIGARSIALFSTAAFGLALAALSLTTANIWSYYGLVLVMSAVSLGTMPTVMAKVVNQWFDRQRGLALGVALCASGLSGMILPVYVQTLISHLGWRAAYVGLGLLPILIAFPCVWFFLPGGVNPAARPSRPTEGMEGVNLRQAVRDYRLWVIAFSAVCAGIGLSGVLANMVPLFIDRGLTPTKAAGLFGFYGLAIVIGRLACGWLLDRFWAPVVGCLFLLIPAFATFVLASGYATSPILASTAIMMGLASGAEFDLVAYLTGRYFGRRHFAAIYTIEYACFSVGAGAAPPVFGMVRDRTGSYDSVLYVTMVLFVCSALAILALGRYPRLAVAAD